MFDCIFLAWRCCRKHDPDMGEADHEAAYSRMLLRILPIGLRGTIIRQPDTPLFFNYSNTRFENNSERPFIRLYTHNQPSPIAVPREFWPSHRRGIFEVTAREDTRRCILEQHLYNVRRALRYRTGKPYSISIFHIFSIKLSDQQVYLNEEIHLIGLRKQKKQKWRYEVFGIWRGG